LVGNNQLATGKESRIFGTLFLCVDRVKFLVSDQENDVNVPEAHRQNIKKIAEKNSHQIFFYQELESYFYNIKPTNMQIQEIKINLNPRRQGEKKQTSPKMYLYINNESLVENLINRRNRPYNEYKKLIIPKVMESISKTHPELFARIKNVKWGWDRYCGCSMCPCSPGFIGEGAHYEPTDIYVTI
jgi:hypothetical protein